MPRCSPSKSPSKITGSLRGVKKINFGSQLKKLATIHQESLIGDVNFDCLDAVQQWLSEQPDKHKNKINFSGYIVGITYGKTATTEFCVQ